VASKYAQKEAFAIQGQLRQLGTNPLPQVWTINRTLKLYGLVAKPIYTRSIKLVLMK